MLSTLVTRKKNNVTALTMKAFRSRFFKGNEYLDKRNSAPFGSARNLSDGSITIPVDEYVEGTLVVDQSSSDSNTETTIKEVARRVADGECLILMAPFGAGKSLTTREVYFSLKRLYDLDQISVVPLAINLREHWGANYGDEILERHARSLGVVPKENLTIAYRAGMIALLIDGFDEVAAQVVAKPDKLNFMRDARFQALQGVRELISQAPSGTGILVCGRDHYFDNYREMVKAIGLTGKRFSIVRLREFTEEQSIKYLEKKGVQGILPDWLPRKPLILGYLAHRNLLEGILSIDATRGFGYAWDEFLTMICEREANLERSVMDPETVRRVLERLSCDVRATQSGTGPVTSVQLAEAYRLEAGQMAGEGVVMQLQRLPGLTIRDQDPDSRSFIDEDMLSALQGSAIMRYVTGEVQELTDKGWLTAMPAKAILMSSYLLEKAGANYSTVITRCFRGLNGNMLSISDRQISADCLMIALGMARDRERVDCNGIQLTSITLGCIDLEEIAIDNIQISDSVIDEIVFGVTGITSKIRFSKCLIKRVRGVSDNEGLPEGMFVECEIDEFDNLDTNNAVLKANLSPALKALVVVLRKLYLQAGGGRQINALKRGVPSGPIFDSIDDILQILEGEKMISITNFKNKVAHPIRKQTTRVLDILKAPSLSNDSIVVKAKELQ